MSGSRLFFANGRRGFAELVSVDKNAFETEKSRIYRQSAASAQAATSTAVSAATAASSTTAAAIAVATTQSTCTHRRPGRKIGVKGSKDARFDGHEKVYHRRLVNSSRS